MCFIPKRFPFHLFGSNPALCTRADSGLLSFLATLLSAEITGTEQHAWLKENCYEPMTLTSIDLSFLSTAL